MLPPLNPDDFELTPEQDFMLERYRREVTILPRPELEDLSIQAMSLVQRYIAVNRALIRKLSE